MKPKKRYGQNFLVNDFYINSIITAIEVFSKDLIIEIGPGKGALTKKLKQKQVDLIAYEVDMDLKPILSKLEDDNTKIVFQDFLTADLLNLKDQYHQIHIVGNLPYYITTPIIEHIINTNIDPKDITIMVQKEVANRFLATPCTKDYGYFTLYLNYYFDIERIIDVPKTAFFPVPKVDSTVIKLKRREIKPYINIEKYKNFLKQSFSQKRKTLKNNLKEYDFEKVTSVLNKYNYNENVRAEELSEEILIEICTLL